MANQAKFGETTFSIGDTVKVYQKIKEAGKTRLQSFQGVVIAIKGREENKTFTVRKAGAGGIGVERIWPLYSPHISKIQIVRKGKVRRAKLFYLRKRVGKRATKVREKVGKVAKVEKVKKKDEEKKSKKSRRKGTPRRGAGRKLSGKKRPETS